MTTSAAPPTAEPPTDEPLTPEPGRTDATGAVFHGPKNRPAKAPRKAAAHGSGKAPRRALGVARPKAPRRPYRGLEAGVLQARLDALRKREESLRARHQRAEVTLGRLCAEDAARAEAAAV